MIAAGVQSCALHLSAQAGVDNVPGCQKKVLGILHHRATLRMKKKSAPFALSDDDGVACRNNRGVEAPCDFHCPSTRAYQEVRLCGGDKGNFCCGIQQLHPTVAHVIKPMLLSGDLPRQAGALNPVNIADEVMILGGIPLAL